MFRLFFKFSLTLRAIELPHWFNIINTLILFWAFDFVQQKIVIFSKILLWEVLFILFFIELFNTFSLVHNFWYFIFIDFSKNIFKSIGEASVRNRQKGKFFENIDSRAESFFKLFAEISLIIIEQFSPSCNFLWWVNDNF